ncbi:TerC family protein [Xanthobacter sediminis]
MLALVTSPEAWAAFVTLTVMEIVLGIDNVVFISLVVQRLPPHQALRARQIGLSIALALRIGLLLALTWLIGLQHSLFSAYGVDISWRDLILIAGGAFLVAKATMEMHAAMEGDEFDEAEHPADAAGRAFGLIIGQVAVLDLVFSIDSILTAIGMAEHVEVMVAAVIVAVGIMFWASGPLSAFIATHPTAKMLALAFLLMVGVLLVADGFEVHVPRGYVYAAMAFSVAVEMLNLSAARRRRLSRRHDAS